MSEKIKNTYEEWCKLKDKIDKHAANNTLDTMLEKSDSNSQQIKVIRINVDVSCDPDDETADIMTLRYAFPIFDVIRESVQAQGELNVCISSKYSCYENRKPVKEEEIPISNLYHRTKAQLQHFMYIQLCLRQSLTIKLNDKLLKPDPTRFGRISPIIPFTKDEKTPFFYKHIYDVIEDKEILYSFTNFLNKYRENPKYDDIKNTYEYKEILKYDEYINPNFASDSKKIFGDSENLSLKTMWSLTTDSKSKTRQDEKQLNVGVIFFKLFLSNISYIASKKIKGSKDDPIDAEVSSELIKTLLDFVETSCWNIPVLAQYIWSVLIRYTFVSSNIIGGSLKERYLVQEFLENTLQSSISFAEGLYQIVENSCYHTATGNSYLSVRIYDTDKNVKPENAYKAIKTICKLSEKFEEYKFDDNTKLYLNLTLVDNSYSSRDCEVAGMVSQYNKTSGYKVQSIKELFEKTSEVTDDELDLWVHYGLRILKKIVTVNSGAFKVTTPGVKQDYYVINGKSVEPNKIHEYNGSSYDILLPIVAKSYVQEEQAGFPEKGIFETKNILNEDFEPLKIDLVINDVMPQTQQEKIECVENLKEQISKAMKLKRKENIILCLHLKDCMHYKIELLAKAVMAYSISVKNDYNRIAVLFDDKKYINEFVRIYSVFFDKSGENYNSFKLLDTQIALCSMRDGVPEVNFILSGNHLSTARQTARMYTYYNSDSTLEFVPLITYLTKTEKEQKRELLSIFPFDLYLDLEDFDSEYKINPKGIIEENVWFFKRIQNVLNTELQKSDYGCKIDDIHVSIGSKIHITSFYNAELLFHNYGNMWKFAYIVAKEILREHKNKADKICLISYESYSSLFIQKVCDIIKQYNSQIDVDFMIYSADAKRMEPEQNEYFWRDLKRFAEKDLENYHLHIVLPIGTTLSTICKIQDVMRIMCKQFNPCTRLNFGKSITLIIVGGIKDNVAVDMKYWKSINLAHKRIVLQNGQMSDNDTNDKVSQFVRYYFNTECEWHNVKSPNEKQNYKEYKCLIGVDKTATVPDVIFEKFKTDKKMFKESISPDSYKENNDRINLIDNCKCVRYSHIYNAGNHFLYDIDYYTFCKNKNISNKIVEWLKTVRSSVDVNAFNIIISPLDIKNSIFLKLVTDTAFESCSRLLHVNINGSYRENVRSKFSYIKKEFERINRVSRDIKVNVYYVDDCIVSGQTLQRGRSFIQMLLADQSSLHREVNIYKGIIVLANRSSYDTIQEMLPGRVEKDFFYFMRLNVPLYNTYNGICPGCELTQKYELMHKRSSTHMIASEYNRLKEKHKLRTIEEYDNFIEQEIFNKKSYLMWFKEWMFFSKYSEKNSTEHIYQDLCSIYKALCDSKDKYNSLAEAIDDLFKDDKNAQRKQLFAKWYRENIVAERAYRRMYSIHEILTTLDDVMVTAENNTKATSECRKRILNIIEKRFKEIDKLEDLDKSVKAWQKAEWFISYIKVTSRSQTAKYYHIRESIYDILSDFIKALIGVETQKEDMKFLQELFGVIPENRFEKSITPDMKFNVFLTTMRRLADLYSPIIINFSNEIFEFYNKCLKQYNAEDDYSSYYQSIGENSRDYKNAVTIISNSDFEFHIARLTKWSTMSGYDGSYCFRLEESFNDANFKKKLTFLENTYIIYMGIKNIVESVVGYNRDFVLNDDFKLEITKILKIGNKDCSEIYLHKIFFDFMEEYKSNPDSTVVLHEKYKNMCLFFAELRQLMSNAKIVDSPYPYRNLCNYMRSIIGFDQCIIAYKEERNARVLASSDIKKEYLTNGLSNEMLSDIIKKFDETAEINDSKTDIVDGIAQKYSLKSSKDAEIFVIKIPVSEADITNAYIVLYRGEIVGNELNQDELSLNDCWNVRNILFLRDRLESVLNRDMASLISMISSYNYVEPLHEDSPVILHISDLHISTGNCEDIIKAINNNQKNVDKPEDALENIRPDLILITGDVVQASYSAPSLVKNYKDAANVIKELASVVWKISNADAGRDAKSENQEFVRSDWQKRIIISTGNHDYASMNELEAQNKARMTTSGIPGANVGSTLIKYSYFIDFLHNLLGIDIDKATKYDLNDIIQYHKLELSVYNLNSGSEVNPYRTNKVKFNAKAINALCKAENQYYDSVHMMHHTPIYNINYISDVYYLSKSTLDKATEKVFTNDRFPKPNNICELWILLIENILFEFKEIEYDGHKLNKDQQIELLRGIIVGIKETKIHTYVEKNLSDILHYLNTDEQERKNDDRCNQFFYSLQERSKMGNKDSEEYSKFMKAYCQKIEKDFYIIGGHEHVERIYKGEFSEALDKCTGIYEAGRFYNKDGKLHYSYLNKSKNYTFVNAPAHVDEVKTNLIISALLTKEKSQEASQETSQ